MTASLQKPYALTPSQEIVLSHLRSAYMGPENGENELIKRDLPSLLYTVGMLFPKDATRAQSNSDELSDSFNKTLLSEGVDEGEIEPEESGPTIAEDWRPTSAAISFVTEAQTVTVSATGGTYRYQPDEGMPQWQRVPYNSGEIVLSKAKPTFTDKADDVPVEIGSRWRKYGSLHLVTVHLRLTSVASGDYKDDITKMLFQVRLSVNATTGSSFCEYSNAKSFQNDDESAELHFQYRNKKIYAVGHGMSADWRVDEDGSCREIWLEAVPAYVVPAIEATGFNDGSPEADALNLAHLSTIDQDPGPVIASLQSFVDRYRTHVQSENQRVSSFKDKNIASSIVSRMSVACTRMQEGVDALSGDDGARIREAFALGMEAMRRQMQRSAINQNSDVSEPNWRPFQLGFILLSLASTVDDQHKDREVVDLIWFPTGGGKTEAYLALAAIEIFRRRLVRGFKGAGTAVITRYTLRLLTTQQFERAAALICAMELMRSEDSRVRGMPRFSIGLWVGNQVTPGTKADAQDKLAKLLKVSKPEDANRFQVQNCPWCSTKLLPEDIQSDPDQYGIYKQGKDVLFRCIDNNCSFNEGLPLQVIDEDLYQNPPTILLATVDKFARLQFTPEAGSLLGIGTPFDQPSLIIQDELHLLSGPLGTTVAVFDSVIQILLKQHGSRPKIVASTATIRSSNEQVRGLYGREVSLYPPSELEDDKTFFSRPISSGEGRLYIGLMPQSVSQATAVVTSATPMLELPEVLSENDPEQSSLDDYWTLVMYHNSLRELGRSNALVRDDISSRLLTRSERLDIPRRHIQPNSIVELTSHVDSGQLPGELRKLGFQVGSVEGATDVVLSSNMLSVGIDVQRLALMLMVGQPKTTAEYIQSTSRVGRGKTRGIIVTLHRSNRARDRSHFETFRSFHSSLYRTVEPTSVTPWSLSSRERSLRGALVALLRHSLTELAQNQDAGALNLEDEDISESVLELVDELLEAVALSDASELEDTREQIKVLLNEWDHRARTARANGETLYYEHQKSSEHVLLKRMGQKGNGWLVNDSMRSVEPDVTIRVREPGQGQKND